MQGPYNIFRIYNVISIHREISSWALRAECDWRCAGFILRFDNGEIHSYLSRFHHWNWTKHTSLWARTWNNESLVFTNTHTYYDIQDTPNPRAHLHRFKCSAVITRSTFPQILSQNTSHSPLVRASYGMYFVGSNKWFILCLSHYTVMCAIPCDIRPRYYGTRLYYQNIAVQITVYHAFVYAVYM